MREYTPSAASSCLEANKEWGEYPKKHALKDWSDARDLFEF